VFACERARGLASEALMSRLRTRRESSREIPVFACELCKGADTRSLIAAVRSRTDMRHRKVGRGDGYTSSDTFREPRTYLRLDACPRGLDFSPTLPSSRRVETRLTRMGNMTRTPLTLHIRTSVHDGRPRGPDISPTLPSSRRVETRPTPIRTEVRSNATLNVGWTYSGGLGLT
jgi:hypothetical protein